MKYLRKVFFIFIQLSFVSVFIVVVVVLVVLYLREVCLTAAMMLIYLMDLLMISSFITVLQISSAAQCLIKIDFEEQYNGNDYDDIVITGLLLYLLCRYHQCSNHC